MGAIGIVVVVGEKAIKVGSRMQLFIESFLEPTPFGQVIPVYSLIGRMLSPYPVLYFSYRPQVGRPFQPIPLTTQFPEEGRIV